MRETLAEKNIKRIHAVLLRLGYRTQNRRSAVDKTGFWSLPYNNGRGISLGMATLDPNKDLAELKKIVGALKEEGFGMVILDENYIDIKWI